MKVSLRVFRLSRKLVYIITGTLLLSGAAGATALYIGRDKLLGSSHGGANGLDCTTAQVTTIHKKNRFWIRKFIRTDSADGLTRVKTALRVAGAVYEKEKPDLVQVVVLDAKGPESRAEMRGHAIGADVIFVAEPEKLAAIGDLPQFSATYTDAPASISGTFYGQKTVMPEEEIHHLLASLSDKTDCLDPAAEAAGEGAAVEGEGAASAEGGEAKAEKSGEKPEGQAAAGGEHGAPKAEAAEGEPAGEGEQASAEGEKPAEAAPAESKGWIDQMKSMVLGDGEAAKPEGEAKPEEAAAGEGGPAHAPAGEGEAAPAESPEPEAAAQPHG